MLACSSSLGVHTDSFVLLPPWRRGSATDLANFVTMCIWGDFSALHLRGHGLQTAVLFPSESLLAAVPIVPGRHPSLQSGIIKVAGH